MSVTSQAVMAPSWAPLALGALHSPVPWASHQPQPCADIPIRRLYLGSCCGRVYFRSCLSAGAAEIRGHIQHKVCIWHLLVFVPERWIKCNWARVNRKTLDLCQHLGTWERKSWMVCKVRTRAVKILQLVWHCGLGLYNPKGLASWRGWAVFPPIMTARNAVHWEAQSTVPHAAPWKLLRRSP